MRLTLALCLVGSLAAPALGQGSDSCTTPTSIAGLGTFAFDNTAASTGLEGQTEFLCYAFGSSIIDNDVWFSWTAQQTGSVIIKSCGTTSIDTKISAYPGGACPTVGSSIACNDDSCGLQSLITFSATSGTTYLLQVGTFPGVAGGTGSLTIETTQVTYNPANGHYYEVVYGNVPWETARLDAEQRSFQGTPGHLVTISDAAEDQFVYFTLTGSALGNSWLGLYQDTLDPNYSEPLGGWKWVTGEPLTYTNWYVAGGEPNDQTGNENHGGYWPADQWNDYSGTSTNVGSYVVEYDVPAILAYCSGDGSGTACPCGNPGGAGEGCANSTGVGASLGGGGSVSVASDNLSFSAAGLVPSQPALLFQGVNAVNSGAGILFGDGLRCAGGFIVRLGVAVPSAAGDASWGPGLAGAGGWVAGETRRFQVWYRDPASSPCGSGFNLSNGAEVLFQP